MEYRDFYESIFKQKKVLKEVTLYHGTTIDNANLIKKDGYMIPSRGEFVSTMYGNSFDNEADFNENVPELVFSTDKKSLKKVVSAMKFHVAKKLNKSMQQVSHNDIINNGALLIFKNGDEFFKKRNGEEDGHPMTVEPNDYYTEDSINPDIILTGRKMVQFLKKLYNKNK